MEGYKVRLVLAALAASRVAWGLGAQLKHGREAPVVESERSIAGTLLLPSLPSRAVAVLIDGAFLAFIVLLETSVIMLARGLYSPNALGWTGAVVLAVLVNAGFLSVFAWVSGGRTVGKALTGTTIQHQDGSPITQSPADLARLFLRFSVGYVVFDVLFVACLWCLRDARQRCPHDLVLRTQVAHLGANDARPKVRLEGLWGDVEAGLNIVRDEWGKLYKLVRWSCVLVLGVTGAFGLLLSPLGWVSSSASTGATVAAGSSATGVGAVVATAVGTTVATAGLVAASAVVLEDEKDGAELFDAFLVYRFEGDRPLMDDVGGRTGRLRGGAQIVEWRAGDNALQLDGTGSMQVAMQSEAQSGSVTAAAWVRASERPDRWATIIGRWTEGYYWLGGSSPAGGYEWWIDAAHWEVPSLEVGKWQHVAGVYDAGTGRADLYLDGQRIATGRRPHIPPPTDSDIYIGNESGIDISGWKGSIDDVGVWEEALTARQVCRIAGGDPEDGNCLATSRG